MKITTIRDLVNAAKAGKYGFNREYILEDRRVKLSFSFDFLDNLKSAIIDYTSWQLMVITEYSHIYGEKVCKEVCENVQSQFDALHKFEDDWKKVEYFDNSKQV